MQEKRRYHRFKVETPMDFKVPPKEGQVPASIRDISGTGVLFNTPEELLAGHELLMYFSLPTNERAEVHARVVRVEREGGQFKVAVRLADRIKFDERDFVKFYAQTLISRN